MFDWIPFINDIDILMKKEKPKVFKYPHFGRMNQIRPNIESLLGHYIYWTVKEDGSNAGVYLRPSGEPMVRSRNMDVAEFQSDMLSLKEVKQTIEMLWHYKDNYGCEYIVFGEYLNSKERRSPTGLKKYDESSFVVFDIWDIKEQKFLPYYTVTMMCGPFEIPVVKLVGICNCSTKEELEDYLKGVMETVKDEEGVVGKVYEKLNPYWEDCYCFFKEKNFIPKPIKEKFIGEGGVQLPQLPPEEVEACLFKVKDRLTEEEFSQTKIVIPEFAKEVQLECKQQNCVNRLNLKRIYDNIVDIVVKS